MTAVMTNSNTKFAPRDSLKSDKIIFNLFIDSFHFQKTFFAEIVPPITYTFD